MGIVGRDGRGEDGLCCLVFPLCKMGSIVQTLLSPHVLLHLVGVKGLGTCSE